MMRYIKLQTEKAPVVKNISWALKLIWKTDKQLPLGAFLEQFTMSFFNMYVKNILFLKTLLTVIDSKGDFSQYLKYLLMFLAVSVLCKALSWYGSYLNYSAVKVILKKLNNLIFKKALSLDVANYEDPKFYDKYQRATDITDRGYFHSLCISVAAVFGTLLSLILVIITVIQINPLYLLFTLPSTAVFAVELAKSRKVYKRDLEMTGNERVKAYIKRTVFLREYSKDMRTSNIFLVMMKRFDAAVKANIMILKEYGFPLFVYSTVSSFFSEFLPTVGTYALAGSQFIYTDTMTISAFSVVVSSINSVNNAANMLVRSFNNISQLALYFSNLREFFDYEPGIGSGKEIPGEFESLEFRNVSFRYLGAEKDSLKNVSFTLNKGEKLAVVGLNGAGKTTLVKLMMRFYDPTEGEILWNGRNIKEFDTEKYRLMFGAVFQDYKNFALSVNENVICRVCDDNDRAFAEEAMKNSGAWDKISTLPGKGETVMTKEFDKNGVGLSGGENQKLSTARLFAHDFEIAVLDEPSSALDPVAEHKMYDNLVRATEGKSVVYISHRLSSAVLSDKIIVLDGGSIAERGNHTELLALGGIYAEMFNHQADSYGKAEVS